jgi:predicted dehydrogenase
MEILKLGIIGAGFVAAFHCRAMMQVRGVEVAGITSRTRASAGRLSTFVRDNDLGDGTVYDSISDMAPHVDAIAIYAPNFVRLAHVEEIAAAVKQGANLKGVICEKPLARNLAEGRRIVSLIEEAGLNNAYFENQSFMKPIRSKRPNCVTNLITNSSRQTTFWPICAPALTFGEKPFRLSRIEIGD